MRKLGLCIAAAALSAAASLANAQAVSNGRLIVGVDPVGGPPPLQDVQFVFGNHNYCWYAAGWRGPGFYWCGYANRRGLGWGGPVGWHGWRAGGPVGHGGPAGHGAPAPHSASAHAAPGGGHTAPPSGGHAGGGGHDGGRR